MELPSRHGEGRILFKDETVTTRIKENHQDVLHYIGPDGKPTEDFPYNPNGTEGGLAGLCNATGRIFGLMPHPEAFLHRTHHPRWTREPELPEEGMGLWRFRNAVDFIRSKLL